MDRGVLAAGAACVACVVTLSAGRAASWSVQPRGQVVEIAAGGKCLEVHAPDLNNNGGRVQLWQCNGSKQQEWLFDRYGIRSGAGKCLNVNPREQDKNGAPVQIWDCNGSKQQMWRVMGAEIRYGSDKCLDAEQQKDGARIQIWECGPSRQQQWNVRPKT